MLNLSASSPPTLLAGVLVLRMTHQRTEAVAGGSVLGPQHTSLARQMTWQAAAAALAFCLVLGLLCMPLVLLFPVGLVVYGASEAVFAVIYW
jgi:hypothetical protein